MAGEQQQEGGAGQLLDGEVVMAGQVGQDVLARLGAFARDQFGKVGGQCVYAAIFSSSGWSLTRNLAELTWKVSRSA